jgi:hypothetical protein
MHQRPRRSALRRHIEQLQHSTRQVFVLPDKASYQNLPNALSVASIYGEVARSPTLAIGSTNHCGLRPWPDQNAAFGKGSDGNRDSIMH